MNGLLALAFTAGMLAPVNPCGFALLPAWITHTLGDTATEPLGVRTARALRTGVAFTLGFAGTLAVAGLAISAGARALISAAPWLGLVVGVALVLLGVVMFTGRVLGLRLPTRALRPATGPGGTTGIVLAGIGYAAASLSCTFGVLLAVIAHRPDLLVLATPFVVIAAWSLASWPDRAPTVRASLRRTRLREGETSAWDVTVDDAHSAEQLISVLEEVPQVRTDPEVPMAIAPVESSTARASITWQPLRWGRRTIGNGTVTLVSAWGAARFGPVPTHGTIAHTSPREETFTLVAAAPHPLGLVGLNRSRRPGDGSEFADIRPFQRGDRLRRVHWPVSARTGQIHVRTTYAEQDTEVLLIVDALVDVGVSDGVDGRQSSLDLEVRAAAALSTHLLARGERVALRAFGMPLPIDLPAGTGARQQRRIQDSLAEIHAAPGLLRARASQHRVHTGPGALVLLLSPLVTRDAAEQAAHLAGRGLTVVVVDCLPPDVTVAGTGEDSELATAWRIRRLERELEVARLQERGVPVIPWNGPGSLDMVLRQIARRPAPRTVVR